jgi:hypothetical protein
MHELKTQLIQYIERMDESQLNIAIGFFKALFGFHD